MDTDNSEVPSGLAKVCDEPVRAARSSTRCPQERAVRPAIAAPATASRQATFAGAPFAGAPGAGAADTGVAVSDPAISTAVATAIHLRRPIRNLSDARCVCRVDT